MFKNKDEPHQNLNKFTIEIHVEIKISVDIAARLTKFSLVEMVAK